MTPVCDAAAFALAWVLALWAADVTPGDWHRFQYQATRAYEYRVAAERHAGRWERYFELAPGRWSYWQWGRAKWCADCWRYLDLAGREAGPPRVAELAHLKNLLGPFRWFDGTMPPPIPFDHVPNH